MTQQRMSIRWLLPLLALTAITQAVPYGRPDNFIYGINDLGQIVEWNPTLEIYSVLGETGQVRAVRHSRLVVWLVDWLTLSPWTGVWHTSGRGPECVRVLA